jgi:hypothetical protein
MIAGIWWAGSRRQKDGRLVENTITSGRIARSFAFST